LIGFTVYTIKNVFHDNDGWLQLFVMH
jgi:hypothetical protein